MDKQIDESRILLLTAKVFLQTDHQNIYLLHEDQVKQVMCRFAEEVQVHTDQLGGSIIYLIDPNEEGQQLAPFKKDRLAITLFVDEAEQHLAKMASRPISLNRRYAFQINILSEPINSFELSEIMK